MSDDDKIVGTFGRLTDPPHVVTKASGPRRRKRKTPRSPNRTKKKKESSVAKLTTEDRVRKAVALFETQRSMSKEALKKEGFRDPSGFFQRPLVAAMMGAFGGIHIREKTRAGRFEAQTIGTPRTDLVTGSHDVGDDYFWAPPEAWLIETALRARLPVCLVGPTGSGKTTLLERLMKKIFGVEAYDMSLNGEMSVSDFYGVRALRNGDTTWDHGPITLAMMEKRPCIVNEMDAAPPEILYCLYRVLEKPKPVQIPTFADDDGKPLLLDPWKDGEVTVTKRMRNKKTKKVTERQVKKTVKSQFAIACTANTTGRGDDTGLYRGAQVLNEAFLDRFVLFLHVDYPPVEAETEILIKKTGIRRDTARLISKVADNARKALRDTAKLNSTFSVRRTLNWAEAVQGLNCSVEQGFVAAVMARASKDDQVALGEFYQREFGKVPKLDSLNVATGSADPFVI